MHNFTLTLLHLALRGSLTLPLLLTITVSALGRFSCATLAHWCSVVYYRIASVWDRRLLLVSDNIKNAAGRSFAPFCYQTWGSQPVPQVRSSQVNEPIIRAKLNVKCREGRFPSCGHIGKRDREPPPPKSIFWVLKRDQSLSRRPRIYNQSFSGGAPPTMDPSLSICLIL